MKTYFVGIWEALLMNTHKICFRAERKILTLYPLKSRARLYSKQYLEEVLPLPGPNINQHRSLDMRKSIYTILLFFTKVQTPEQIVGTVAGLSVQNQNMAYLIYSKYSDTLPYLPYVFGQTGLSKQCKPRWDLICRVSSGSKLYQYFSAVKNALFRAMHLPVLNFQQVHFTTRWCVEKLLYEWQIEYSLIRSSVLIWVYTACPGISVPLSGHIQQTTNWWYFSYSSQKTGFDISCKLSPLETVCMKCQNLFSGKNKKNISKCRLLKFLPRVLSGKSRFLMPLFKFQTKETGTETE